MSVLAAIAVGLLMGVAFGFLLEKSRVFEPGVILGQMQLRNFLMLRIFLASVASGLIVLALGTLTGIVPKLDPKAVLYGAQLLGGFVTGVGIALAGACPGTVLAQVGVGYRDARLTLLGGLAGALTFAYLEPAIRPVLLTGSPGRLTLHGLLDLPFWPLALGFAALLIVALYALERWRPWRAELGERADGVLPERPETGPLPSGTAPAGR
ncbi:YeeE/YedE thiosulfate transporter family protein [Elioraea sp.]|jgi:hypothetical protein|uniref:YeeE/YedE thiosulfate transporter family protein n=1 Tax=Elioraea sp. TaxID=2185103 RepID=UPI0021DDDFAB|nr:YeeE/YedE thiosulfate transporter family protein [Elioraea sp.]GIX09639.1 MAG: hypothetical protein KatS3mg116_1349 [Elioraea sp.]